MSKIVACGNEITDIKYSGFTITKVYACGGELVYSKSEEPTIVCDDYKLTYQDTIGYQHKISYNGNYQITTLDTGVGSCDESSPYRKFVVGKCVESIEQCAFVNGGNVTVGENVKYIGERAFANSSGRITFLGVNPPIIHNTAFSGGTGEIRVPCEALNRYKDAWPDYESRITSSSSTCTQLPIYANDGSYDYIELTDNNKGTIKLPSLSGFTNPTLYATVYMQTANYSFADSLIYSKNGDWGVFSSNSDLGYYTNGVTRRTSCSVAITGQKNSLTIGKDIYLGGCGFYNVNVNIKEDLYAFRGNGNGKIYSITVEDNNTTVINLIPMLYCDKPAFFDTIGHRVYTSSGNLAVGND